MSYAKVSGIEARLLIEECKASWHEEARNHAVQDADKDGLRGEARTAYIQVWEAVYYAELEKTGMGGMSDE